MNFLLWIFFFCLFKKRMDVLKFQKVFFFLCPPCSAHHRWGWASVLHCTSSVMLQIPGFYRVRLAPPSLRHGGTSELSASSRPIADCCSEERAGWFSESLSAKAGRAPCGRAGFLLIFPSNDISVNHSHYSVHLWMHILFSFNDGSGASLDQRQHPR